MKAAEANLLKFLRNSPQFVIPIYQRTYSWTEGECRQLWDDILKAGQSDKIPAHFLGSIVYVEKGLYQVSDQAPVLVIDGQQRLTTVTLLIAALKEAVGDAEPIDGFSARKLTNYYLLNPEEHGDKRYKLILSQTDKESLLAAVDNRSVSGDESIRIADSLEFYRRQIKAYQGDISDICNGLAKLLIVDIALDRQYDNPQLIFESMNSTGRELTQTDLVRNFILMGLEPNLQTQLYEQYWRPMEKGFGQEAYQNHFNWFMRYYLIFRTGEIPRFDQVYEAFRRYTRQEGWETEALVADIRTLADYYCRMALRGEGDPQLAKAFGNIRELKVDVAYPFLLELYSDFTEGTLNKGDFLEALKLVESYVFRRAICNIPTNSLNKTFATFNKALKKDRYLESIKAHFLTVPSYRRFPNDEEFIREIKVRDLYNFRSRSYWLRRLENHDRKEPVPVDEYTIEHIMPQNPDLSQPWRDDLGSDWERIHAEMLHTLGNLTLTGYNSEYSDRPFQEKRDMTGGFGESPLKLNQGLGQVETWNESAISARAERLASLAVKVWGAPALPADILAAYRPEPAVAVSYTLDDHEHLSVGPIRQLFELFRNDVLVLDPCVNEEILKLYIAYKAETNFVDVVIQTKRLRLSLNMGYHELHDPRGLAKDVTNLGRWGNGDVEVSLSSVEELPYIMGLVRQAFEKQMGNEKGDS